LCQLQASGAGLQLGGEAGGGVVEELGGVACGAGGELGESDAGVGEAAADGFVQHFPAVAGG
jgi:hypothetical protein